uniref:Uncharacterized protein LOC113799115 n=1 Tax=Dermatophagoides pteronyssinus TaxID=6956 RepID=A0A6P6YJV2_DERPT|nr:uncharacterized protein LOC113799115 [Dermatophagoides pteronyssinus]
MSYSNLDYKTCLNVQICYINRFESLYRNCKRKNCINRSEKRSFRNCIDKLRQIHQVLLMKFNLSNNFINNSFESKVNELIELYGLKLVDNNAHSYYNNGVSNDNDDNKDYDRNSKTFEEQNSLSSNDDFGQIQREPPVPDRHTLFKLFRQLTNQKHFCPACFYIGHKFRHSFHLCRHVNYAYKLYKQTEQESISSDISSRSDSGFETVSDSDGNSLSLNSIKAPLVEKNRIQTKIIRPKPILEYRNSNLNSWEIECSSSSLLKSMNDLNLLNASNIKWTEKITTPAPLSSSSSSLPNISIKPTTFIVNLISKCRNQIKSSIVAMLNFDINSNYILKSFLDKLENFNFGEITLDPLPKYIAKRNIYKRIGILTIETGIGFFHKPITFIILDGDDKRSNVDGIDDISRNLHHFGIVISSEELPNFFIDIPKKTSSDQNQSTTIDLKQSIKMFDFSRSSKDLFNDGQVSLPSFTSSILSKSLPNATVESEKEVIFGSVIRYKVKPMIPISNPWMKKLFMTGIISSIHQSGHDHRSLLPMKISIRNSSIKTDTDNFCVDSNMKIYYHFETAIADGLISIDQQTNHVARYNDVIIYYINGEYRQTVIEKVRKPNDEQLTYHSLMIKFQPSKFIIIIKINTFDGDNDDLRLSLANYIRMNVNPM